MLSFAIIAAMAAAVIVMHVAYNKYDVSIITTIGLGLAASVFVGGGIEVGFVPSEAGVPSILFGTVLGLLFAVTHVSPAGHEHGEEEKTLNEQSSSFPMTHMVSGRIMDISMPSVVFTDKSYTLPKAA